MTPDQARTELIRALLEWQTAGGSVADVADAIIRMAVICAGGQVVK